MKFPQRIWANHKNYLGNKWGRLNTPKYPRGAATGVDGVPQSTKVKAVDFHLLAQEFGTLLSMEATVITALVEPGLLGCSGFSETKSMVEKATRQLAVAGARSR